MQVSPMEIEAVLLAEPRNLITDTAVAGVSGGRISDEKVPRAWVVLSSAGRTLGADATIRELKAWHEDNLSKYKWLRGGIEVVQEVCHTLLFRLFFKIYTEGWVPLSDSKVADGQGAEESPTGQV